MSASTPPRPWVDSAGAGPSPPCNTKPMFGVRLLRQHGLRELTVAALMAADLDGGCQCPRPVHVDRQAASERLRETVTRSQRSEQRALALEMLVSLLCDGENAV